VHQDQVAGEVGILGPHHQRPEPSKQFCSRVRKDLPASQDFAS
jgi:hypothetical protein